MSINKSLRCIACAIWTLIFMGFLCTADVYAQGEGGGAADTTKKEQAADPAAGGGAGGSELSSDAGVIAKGQDLFKSNCKQCHQINAQMVGPALKDVTVRRTVPWLINFIKTPEKVIKSGDPYAAALYEKFKAGGYMPNHDFLKDDEIVAILSWVKAGKDIEVAGPKVEDAGGAQAAKGPSSGVLIAIISALVGLLLIVILAMAVLTGILSKYIKQNKMVNPDDEEILAEKLFNVGAIIRTPGFIGLAGFLFIAIVFKSVIGGLFSIGVQQGYAPEQPIKFSHKLHAGYYEIDCKYCHTGAARGKSAGIPSSNICMNCHNTIRNTSPEIQKIYKAIEENKPIKWVRIHNLPDHAYFNHSQHVGVAGLDCENCHGDVKNMEVVQQVSLLTMGWCIDCHRKTDVNSKGNGYYDKLVKLHAEKSKKPLKVEDIGGLECGKCHY